MIDLLQVSRTAILLLICRAIESEKNKTLFDDPMAVLCLERLTSIVSEEDRRWILKKKRMYEGYHERDAIAGVQKGKVFDNAANRFIADNPKCTVTETILSLGIAKKLPRDWEVGLKFYVDIYNDRTTDVLDGDVYVTTFNLKRNF